MPRSETVTITMTLKVIALSVLMGLTTVAPCAAAPTSGVISLVRHAERVQAPMDEDPPLTDAGRARAQRLASLLAQAGVKTIFTTRFRRTRETAEPLATALKLQPEVESETHALVSKLKAHAGEIVLVVGHSDTVPDIISAFGGPTMTIADDQFDDVFVLVPATGACVRLKY
jgi:phosphohistidine phosphatase SixA